MVTQTQSEPQKKAESFYTLPPLPYAQDALAPHMSAETLEYHYGKHHKGYVDKLNELIVDSNLKGLPLEEVVKRAEGKLFNNAAQAWNHTFFWNCLTPDFKELKQGELFKAIEESYGNIDQFKTEFSKQAADIFGTGWAWLVRDNQGRVQIDCREDADNPIVDGLTPLLVCDMWEHAYYIDYRNSRPNFLKNFWQIVNWDFVQSNFYEAMH